MENLTLEIVKNYLRVEHNEDDQLIQLFMSAALKHIRDITGMTDDQMFVTATTGAEGQDPVVLTTLIDDLVIPVLLLVGEFYDNRTIQVNQRVNTVFNEAIDNLIGKHRYNLL